MLEKGSAYDLVKEVLPENTAAFVKSGSLEVLSTPSLTAFMEEACVKCIEGQLAEGQTTVGVRTDVQHIAATPVGMNVKLSAELYDLDEKRLKFTVNAYDDKELIAHAQHIRCVVNVEKFMARAQKKLED